MKRVPFKPFAFAKKLLDEAGVDEITDDVLHDLAKKGAAQVDELITLPGHLGSLVDASNIDRMLLEFILYHALHEARDAAAEED